MTKLGNNNLRNETFEKEKPSSAEGEQKSDDADVVAVDDDISETRQNAQLKSLTLDDIVVDDDDNNGDDSNADNNDEDLSGDDWSSLLENECAHLELMLESLGHSLPSIGSSGSSSSSSSGRSDSNSSIGSKRRHAISINPLPATATATKEEQLALASTVLKTGIKPKLHKFRGKEYPNTWIGSQAVDLLLTSRIVATRIEGEQLCRELAKTDTKQDTTNAITPLFHAVRMSMLDEDSDSDDDRLFADNYYFYRFSNDQTDSALLGDEGGNDHPPAPPTRIPSRTESMEWRKKWTNFELKWTSKLDLLQDDEDEDNDGNENNGIVGDSHAMGGDDAANFVTVRSKIHSWMKSFRRLDPRYCILNHFQETAQLGVEFTVDRNGGKKIGVPKLMKYLPNRANIFTIWRPTSNDAIKKMMLGQAVGKGLDIKGKSAKYPHKLSGYVPFLQIGVNAHKHLVDYKYLRKDGRIRVYFNTTRTTLDNITQELETIKEELLSKVVKAKGVTEEASAQSCGEKELNRAHAVIGRYDMAHPTIDVLDALQDTSIVGLELPMRLFWEVFVIRQDITRIPGSHYDPDRPSEPANQSKNILTLVNHKPPPSTNPLTNASPPPRPVLYQMDDTNPYNVQELLMAYEENNTVKPVASDFDAFLVGTRRVSYDVNKDALPEDQLRLLQWLIKQIGVLLDSPPRPSSWDIQWSQTLVRENKAGDIPAIKRIPPLGFGDQRSYKIMKHAVSKLTYGGK